MTAKEDKTAPCRVGRAAPGATALKRLHPTLGKVFLSIASSITNADALTKSAFSIIEEYHPSAYLLLQSREKWQKVQNFKRFGVFTLAPALVMLYILFSGLGAGLSASRRAWERVSLHEPLKNLY